METSSVDLVEFLRVFLTPRDPRVHVRLLRLEFEGAFWHITSRGNERKDIFRQDGDRLEFLSLLAGRQAFSLASPTFALSVQ